MGELNKEKITKLIGEHYLRKALEGILSVSTHIVSRLPGGVKSKDYTEVIVTLGDFEVLPKEFARKIRGLAGYRNRLVHLYWKVTPEELHEKVSRELQDIDMFVEYILQYLRGDSSAAQLP